MPIWAYIGGAAFLAGLLGGWTVRDWKADSDALAAVQHTDEVREHMQTQLNEQSTKYEELRAQQGPAQIETRNTVREIYRDKPVSADCAAPAAVGGLLAGNIATANAAATGKSGSAMSGPTASTKPTSGPGSDAVGN